MVVKVSIAPDFIAKVYCHGEYEAHCINFDHGVCAVYEIYDPYADDNEEIQPVWEGVDPRRSFPIRVHNGHLEIWQNGCWDWPEDEVVEAYQKWVMENQVDGILLEEE